MEHYSVKQRITANQYFPNPKFEAIAKTSLEIPFYHHEMGRGKTRLTF